MTNWMGLDDSMVVESAWSCLSPTEPDAVVLVLTDGRRMAHSRRFGNPPPIGTASGRVISVRVTGEKDDDEVVAVETEGGTVRFVTYDTRQEFLDGRITRWNLEAGRREECSLESTQTVWRQMLEEIP